MAEVWFFLIRTNTGYIKQSKWYDSFEGAESERSNWRWDHIFEEPITPILKGYKKE